MTLLKPPQILTQPLDPDIQADIDKFRQVLSDHERGAVSDDVFRVFRLTTASTVSAKAAPIRWCG